MLITKILAEYFRRVLRNYKIYTVSILGMGVAIIASFHIYHFVYKELSVDKFHEKREEMYRVLQIMPSSSYRNSMTSPSLGKHLKDNIPEVADFCRVVTNNAPIDFIHEGQKTKEDIIYVEDTFFKLFSFKLVEGDFETFRNNENSIIITQKKANQFFKGKSAVGKFIEAYERSSSNNKKYVVAGVIEDIPKNSTLKTDIFLNIRSHTFVSHLDQNENAGWRTGFTELYLYLPGIKDTKDVTNKMTDLQYERLVDNGLKDINKDHFKYELQRLDTIYFDSFDVTNQTNKGSLQFVRVLILVSLLTLVLAVFNYILMNLGLKLNRTDELKVRRCLGASKFNIFLLFLFESIFNVLVCFGITLLTFPLLSPLIKKLIGFDYELALSSDHLLLYSYLFIILGMAIIAGAMEFFLSYKLIFSLEKNIKWTSSWFSKKVIIGFQLTLFIGLIICFLLIRKQINYIQIQDLGYDKKVASVGASIFDEALISELKTKSYVNNIAAGDMIFQTQFHLDDVTIKTSQNQLKAMVITGDTNYLSTQSIKLLEGRNIASSIKPSFSGFFRVGWTPKKSDDLIEILVNEDFVKKANIQNPIGTVITSSTKINKAVIVGVFENIRNTPLYNPTYPIVIGFGFDNFPIQMLQISYDENYEKELATFLKDLYIKKGILDVDDARHNILYKVDYDDIYKKELQLKRLLEAFTIIVLFISLLGLVAISLFITESKTKEIGIRKVNGATINQIMFMLNRDFIKWVAIAFVIACPIAYYAMHKWLENFAYKTELSWWVFALAGVFTLVIALLTVSWQTYRAATRNPVESLRTE